jgi:hypothetical protein
MALTAVAGASPALALPPSSSDPLWLEPVRAEPVEDAVLAQAQGKYYGADMLVGVRIDLVTQVATAGGGTAAATGALYIRRTDTGFIVQVDSRTQAAAGTDAAPLGNAIAVGGDTINVQGIGQVTQIAGDGNRMGNVALISVVGDLAAPQDFNGQTQSQSQDGALTATVHFDGTGMQLGVGAAGASIGQNVTPGPATSGSILQFGRIAGDGFAANNSLQMQVMTTAMPTLSLQQAGIQQALIAIAGLPH